MILDHETPDEKLERVHFEQLKAEQELDKVYHAMPEWVHKLYPDKSLGEKLKLAFEHQHKLFSGILKRDAEEKARKGRFILYLMETHNLDYMENYWAFLLKEEREKKKI